MVSVVTTLSERRDHPIRGIATYIGNLLLMSLLGAMVKILSLTYPLSEILLIRFVFAMLFFWGLLFWKTGLAGLATGRPLDHAVRSLSGIFGLAMLYYALTAIPIADATAISFAAPIFVTLFSIFLLNETIGIRRWLAVFVGFSGVLLIAQPGGAEWGPGVFAAIASAIGGALVTIWLRRLSATERSVTVGLYYNSAGTLVCIGWVLITGALVPNAIHLPMFLVFGIMCVGQQWLLTISFRYAEASLLAPFSYLAMIFAALVGFVFLGEVPILTTWLGAAVIAASGLFLFKRKQQISSDKS